MLSALSGLFYGSEQSKYQENIKKRLEKDLDKKINVDHFINKMKETHSCISGSYILQIIHDLEWEGSDIDIFTTEKYGMDMYRFLQSHLNNGTVMEKNYIDTQTMENNRKHNITMHTGTYDYVICKVYEFMVNSIKIQLIIMDDDYEDHETKMSHFDLDFCKVSFDGDKFIINESALKKEGIVSKMRLPSMKTFDRIMKYEKRGFVVKNKVDVYEQLLGLYSSMFKSNGYIGNPDTKPKH
jgi:hypothetical protein